MRKIYLDKPVLVSQNPNEPMRAGGWQNPSIRNADGVLYIRFRGVKDAYENLDGANRNPVYRSTDGGATWEQEKNNAKAWAMAQKPIANGDRVTFEGPGYITETSAFPKPAPERSGQNVKRPNFVGVYTNDEIRPFVGDEALAHSLICRRIKKGTDEMEVHKCKVDWKNAKGNVLIYNGYVSISQYLCGEYRVDKDGTIYMPASGMMLLPDGSLASRYSSMFFLKSTDNGYSWEYVGGIPYKEEYNVPNAIEVEGFMECCFEIAEDGSFFTIMRSGSLSPYVRGDDEHPAPKCFIAYSYDKGKTWTTPEVFYDYGILPRSTKLSDGTFLMTSGRPDVYIRLSKDKLGKDWGEVIHVLEVPEKDKYLAYEQYTCSNNGVCAYDDHTAFVTYSDLQAKTPDGVRANSIFVRKITITEE